MVGLADAGLALPSSLTPPTPVPSGPYACAALPMKGAGANSQPGFESGHIFCYGQKMLQK